MIFQHITINVNADDFLRYARVMLFDEVDNNKLRVLSPEGPKEVSFCYYVKPEDSIMVERAELQRLVDSLYEQGIRPSQLGNISWLLDLIQTYLAKRDPVYEPLK